MEYRTASTPLLEIGYVDDGPTNGKPLLLLHGWPDDIHAWDQVAPVLHRQGLRTITPYLRGFGPTRFHSPATVRDARAVALTQDAIDLLDALEVEAVSVIGHDWGARIAYSLAGLFPERVIRIIALSLPFQPGGTFPIPTYEQCRRFWYQLFLCSYKGAEQVRKDPVSFSRFQWETWAPAGWFDESAWNSTSLSFQNPDYPAITLHSYRTRWMAEEVDPRYELLQERLDRISSLSVSTLQIHGNEDYPDPPALFQRQEDFFTGFFRRELLAGIGHFPMREQPLITAELILEHLTD